MARFPEIERLESLLLAMEKFGCTEKLATIATPKGRFPIYGISLGNPSPDVPVFGLFGGVHGLEKIGSHVVLSHLESLLACLEWDDDLNRQLQEMRIVSIPIVNPGGMVLNWRANPRGIDIMRNSPVDASRDAPAIFGGHRLGPWLPWYRGETSEPLEKETRTLIDFVETQMFRSPFSMSLDVHSGFGMVDRIWYPYGKTQEEFPLLSIVHRFQRLLKAAAPYHVYKIEPQSASYLIHGDTWDYLFDLHFNMNKNERLYIPWTLEMGSWLWMRKNPRQALSWQGLFNPIMPHRYRRILRRHHTLLDLMRRAVHSFQRWTR